MYCSILHLINKKCIIDLYNKKSDKQWDSEISRCMGICRASWYDMITKLSNSLKTLSIRNLEVLSLSLSLSQQLHCFYRRCSVSVLTVCKVQRSLLFKLSSPELTKDVWTGARNFISINGAVFVVAGAHITVARSGGQFVANERPVVNGVNCLRLVRVTAQKGRHIWRRTDQLHRLVGNGRLVDRAAVLAAHWLKRTEKKV